MEQAVLGSGPVLYTVAEVAAILRVDTVTIYRSIRENAFPAVRIRSRYVIPASAVVEMAAEAAGTGGCFDLARDTQTVRSRRVARPH